MANLRESSLVGGSDLGNSEVNCTRNAQVLHDSLTSNVCPLCPKLLRQGGLNEGDPRSNALHLVSRA